MPNILTAVATIKANPAPVICLDTCVLLDIVRAPLRDTAAAVQAALDLVTGVQRVPPTVYPVIACPTPTEWDQHIGEAVADCSTAVNSVKAVSEVWNFLGVAGIPLFPPQPMPLPDRLRDLSKTLRDAAILLDKDPDALSRAIERVIQSQFPAKKGGKGAKDAVIMEHAVGLARELRAAGFAGHCVFASSNTSDFAEPKTTGLHPTLVPLFAAPANLEYAASITAAVASLKARGWAP